jgi:hypothetical protein
MVCMGLACTLRADSAYYYAGYYRFNCATTAQLNLYKSMMRYVAEARRAALYSLGGRYPFTGYIDVQFVNSGNNGTCGSTPIGKMQITLNTYYNFTGAYWGSILAHETCHVYFYIYTKAKLWNSGLLYYRTFLAESLAWYAGDMVYKYGNLYSASTVKGSLKYAYSRSKIVMNFPDTGYYYYRYGPSDQVRWQLRAQGYFLANNYGYSKVTSLMDRLFGSSFWGWGQGVCSLSSTEAQKYFDNCFYSAYGKHLKDLYSDFYKKWYL